MVLNTIKAGYMPRKKINEGKGDKIFKLNLHICNIRKLNISLKISPYIPKRIFSKKLHFQYILTVLFIQAKHKIMFINNTTAPPTAKTGLI